MDGYIGLTWPAIIMGITYTGLLFGSWWCMVNWMLNAKIEMLNIKIDPIKEDIKEIKESLSNHVTDTDKKIDDIQADIKKLLAKM